MITFKMKTGLEGYEMTKDIRQKYLGTGTADSHDEAALHIAGYENGIVICSGRLYSRDNISCVIDNVTVDEDNRLQYVGDTVLRALEDKAVGMIKAIVRITPNEESRKFFEAEGYIGADEMKKDLTKVRGCRGCSGGAKK